MEMVTALSGYKDMKMEHLQQKLKSCVKATEVKMCFSVFSYNDEILALKKQNTKRLCLLIV